MAPTESRFAESPRSTVMMTANSSATGMVAADTSSYYVICYQPENATMDGKNRSIEIRAAATARDLHIRARKGYAAVNLPPQEFVKR